MAKKKTSFRSTSRRLALEPRLLFDGAGAVAAVDAIHQDQDADQHTSSFDTPPLISDGDGKEALVFTSFDANRSPLELADSAEAFERLLTDASALVQDKLQTWVNSADFANQAAQIFSADAGSADWNAQLDALRTDIINASYSIRTEVRSNEELMQVLGAWTASGTTGERTIYLNAAFLEKASAAQVQQVLLEEIGHDIDYRINSGKDSVGDEGHAFASLLMTGNADLLANQAKDDHRSLTLSGVQVSVETAGGLNIVQTHFIPVKEADLQDTIAVLRNSASGTVRDVIAISATSNGTVVVYDHWESGAANQTLTYEADLSNPNQASTEVWLYEGNKWYRDLDKSGTLTAGDTEITTGGKFIVNGPTLVLKDDVDVSKDGSTLNYDSRDQIGSNKAISVTRAGWSENPGLIVAGALNLFDVANAGKEYTLPVGDNLNLQYKTETGGNASTNPGTGMINYTTAHIIAYHDGTEVQIDKDGDGTFETTVPLDKGRPIWSSPVVRVPMTSKLAEKS